MHLGVLGKQYETSERGILFSFQKIHWPIKRSRTSDFPFYILSLGILWTVSALFDLQHVRSHN